MSGLSKVGRDNFITIQGWMITDLKLKGNELLIYACIYGFSQAENQVFNGSRQYLADWTNSTTKGVANCLKSLVEKGYLEKRDNYINGVKFCDYRVTKFPSPGNIVPYPGEKSSLPPREKSSPNNIDLDNKENNIVKIIDYLNQKLGSKYSSKTRKTVEAINARFAEIPGLSVEDFYSVIDKKYDEWHGDSKMEQYLRPETLFGTKFEGYLNAPAKRGKRKEPEPEWMRKEQEDKEIEEIKRLNAYLNKKTAGNDPEIAAKAAALKEKIAGG